MNFKKNACVCVSVCVFFMCCRANGNPTKETSLFCIENVKHASSKNFLILLQVRN